MASSVRIALCNCKQKHPVSCKGCVFLILRSYHVKHHQHLHVFRTQLTWIAQNSVRPIELKYITVATILHGDLVIDFIFVTVGSQ
jgi:hypothetical protein